MILSFINNGADGVLLPAVGTVFSCRLQGKRAKKTKDMIKELIDND